MSFDALPDEWDAVVVGAGIAGCAAAFRLARGGLRVLLVEKNPWPRDKACGGCVNAAALRELEACGLGDATDGGRPYARMRLAAGGRRAGFPLPAGRAISRRRLDAALAARAVTAGAHFLPGTRAVLGAAHAHGRDVSLRRGRCEATVTAAVVLDCGGLAGRLSDAVAGETEVAANAYIGVAAVLRGGSPFYRPDTIHMACGEHGYVGLVAAEEDRVNVAAAMDPRWVKRVGGPSPAVAAILKEARFPAFDALHEACWHGTPRLSCRRRRLGGERVLILGDAAGYVEPFTGEGMAWALADAAAVAPFARAAVERWRDDVADRWGARHMAIVHRRRGVCRAVTRLLRHPRLLSACLPLIAMAPAAVAPLTAWVNRDFRLDPAAGG